MNRIAMPVILVLTSVSVLFAQLPTATILGQVKDASGAVVAGAKVTARNTDTGQTRTTITGDDGSYRLDALPVGNYEISTEKTGFKTEVQRGLTLSVAQQAVANFTIQVGEMSQTVAVTAEAPLISTTTSTLGGLVDDQRIADLPLNGRNYNDLTLLQPGVTQHIDGTVQAGIGYAGTEYSANGAPIRSNAIFWMAPSCRACTPLMALRPLVPRWGWTES